MERTSEHHSTNTNRVMDDIWKFLDEEDDNDQVQRGYRKRLSKESFKPAAYGGVLSGSVRSVQNDSFEAPMFAQKFGSNIHENGVRPSQKRLPRTSADDPGPVYGVPNKVRNSLDAQRTPSLTEVTPIQGTLVKRYETGSILSTISSGDHPPIVYHDNEMLIRSSRSDLRENHRLGDGSERNSLDVEEPASPGRRKRITKILDSSKKNRCSGRVLLLTIVAILVAGAVVAIVLGVTLSSKKEPCQGNVVGLEGSLKFDGVSYDSLYTNMENNKTRNVTASICEAFEKCFERTNETSMKYNNCTITSYRSGSVIANFWLELTSKPIADENLTDFVVTTLNNDFQSSNGLFLNIFTHTSKVSLINNTVAIIKPNSASKPPDTVNKSVTDTTGLSPVFTTSSVLTSNSVASKANDSSDNTSSVSTLVAAAASASSAVAATTSQTNRAGSDESVSHVTTTVSGESRMSTSSNQTTSSGTGVASFSPSTRNISDTTTRYTTVSSKNTPSSFADLGSSSSYSLISTSERSSVSAVTGTPNSNSAASSTTVRSTSASSTAVNSTAASSSTAMSTAASFSTVRSTAANSTTVGSTVVSSTAVSSSAAAATSVVSSHVSSTQGNSTVSFKSETSEGNGESFSVVSLGVSSSIATSRPTTGSSSSPNTVSDAQNISTTSART